MIDKLLIYTLFIASLINIGYPLTCYVCMTKSCGDPFKYSGDTSSLYKDNYGSSYIACVKVVASDGTIRRDAVTFYYGKTWKAGDGQVYGCQTDLCNSAVRMQSLSTLMLLVGGFIIKKYFF